MNSLLWGVDKTMCQAAVNLKSNEAARAFGYNKNTFVVTCE